VKRHRFAVAAAASAAVLSIGFAAAMGVQAQRIAKERDRANRQAKAAQRVANFMKGMLKVSDPSEARGNSITAREILDNGSKDGNAGSSLAVIWFQLGSNEGLLNRWQDVSDRRKSATNTKRDERLPRGMIALSTQLGVASSVVHDREGVRHQCTTRRQGARQSNHSSQRKRCCQPHPQGRRTATRRDSLHPSR